MGQLRPDTEQLKGKVAYSDICKSELRQSDRRAAICVENIFLRTKKLQMKILLGRATLLLENVREIAEALTQDS